MSKAKTIFTLSFAFFYSIGFAQSLFIDSGQRLGNSCSWDVKLGDLNGDGFLDAVVTNTNNADSQFKNEIWLNNGDASFSKSTQELGVGGSITLFDLDSDGNLDIIETISSNIRTWINDGRANFTLSDKYQFRGTSVTFDENINNDNQYAAITSEIKSNNTLLRIYSLNQTTAEIKDSLTINNFVVFGTAIGDLNNDGYSDLVLWKDNGPASILINDRNGSFTISNQKPGSGFYPNICLGDLNGDGSLDILRCNYHNPVTGEIYPAQLYINDGTGIFTKAVLHYNSAYITPNAAIVDLDNDGDLDIYLNHGHRVSDFSHKSEILFNDGHGNFSSSTINLDLVPSTGMAFGDLDKDGDIDLFLACGNLTENGFIGEPNRVWLNTTIATGIEEKEKNIQIDYNLFQNYPNPFNPSTVVSYQLPIDGNVNISIYNLLGQKIKTLVDSFQNAEVHSTVWNGMDDSNTPVSSGVYFYLMEAEEQITSKKMILMR